MAVVYLSMGANRGKRMYNLLRAMVITGRNAGRITGMSSVYQTSPWGYDSQHRYLNLVVEAETILSPHDLIRELLATEARMGRKRAGSGYEDRKIDIDILSYDNVVIEEESLVIPHPRLHLRRFILVPLLEVSPAFVHPVFGKSVSELLRECKDEGLVLPYMTAAALGRRMEEMQGKG